MLNSRIIKFIINQTKPYRIYLFGLLLTTCLITVDNVARPYLVKMLIDVFASNSIFNPWLICVFYACSQVMLSGSWALNDFCTVRYISHFKVDIAKHFMNKLYDQSHSFFQNNLSGSLNARLNDAFSDTPKLIATIFNEFTYFILLILVSVGMFISISPVFALILICWISAFMGIIFYSSKKSIPLTHDYTKSKAQILGLAADYLTNMASVKAFANRKYEMTSFDNFRADFIKNAFRQGYFLIKFFILKGIFTIIYTSSFLGYLIIGYKQGWITAGDATFVIMSNFNIISTTYQLSNTLKLFVIDLGTVDYALKMLDQIPQITDMPNAQDLVVTNGKIHFDKVNFHYKGSDLLFEDRSVIIEPGQKVGLVGHSGSGKSTFVNLIMRLYNIDSGAITIDEQDIKTVTQDSLKKAVTIISQDPALFHRSIIDNIRYGNINATDEMVITAAKRAHADDFITELPLRYNTFVGEKGVKISGGQRQRIAIARAILKNTQILILDEATSQLDSITENFIQESLQELMHGKTAIIIAHRLSTLLTMDRILVFEGGNIVEDGKHEDLLKLNGCYKALWDAQISGFLIDTDEQ